MDDKIVAIVRRALIVAAIVLLVSVVWTGSRNREPSPSQVDEQVFCASAICFYDSVRGKECLDFPPTVSKLIPVPDVRGDSVRLVIEATGKECKERR